MAVKAGGLEPDLVDRLLRLSREQLDERDAALFEPFVRQYFQWVPPDDLTDREEADLLAACLAHFRLALERSAEEAKVRVYNPDPERDGFSSPHTLIDIVSADMPFIVDSVTMELARQGHSLYLQIHPVMWARRDRSEE